MASLEQFISTSKWREKGALVLDLDGTALHEDRGKISIPDSVRTGVKAAFDYGRPVILNTLRFPLSVMRTIGHEWYEITREPIPAVLLNGGTIGTIYRSTLGVLSYDEIEAFPLTHEEIQSVADGIQILLNSGAKDIAVFYYARDWIRGETIWVPDGADIGRVQKKYVSSSRTYSSSLEDLADNMKYVETCMIFVLADVSEDNLMAYQHADPRGYFTHRGIDKTEGLRRMAEKLGVSLPDSVGAGDTPLDNFLSAVGCAIRVGKRGVQYEGLSATLDVDGAQELGELFDSTFNTAKAAATV